MSRSKLEIRKSMNLLLESTKVKVY